MTHSAFYAFLPKWSAIAAFAIGIMCPTSRLIAQPILAESHFYGGTDGWTALRSHGDIPFNPANPVEVTWSTSGGNPSGFLQYADPSEARATFAKAPASFLGDRSSAFGGMLSFDLEQSATNSQFDEYGRDVAIQGGGITLAYKLPSHPGKVWTHFDVSLTEAGWFDDNNTGPAATKDQMKAVLGALSALFIRIEYRSGQDTDGLDNVVLTGTRPMPPAGSQTPTPTQPTLGCGAIGTAMPALLLPLLAIPQLRRRRPRS